MSLQKTNTKRVQFNDTVQYHSYEGDSCRVFTNPSKLCLNASDSLSTVHDILKKCRASPISVVFGNVGRQPHLLTYYVDVCFPNDTVGFLSKEPTGSPYQVDSIEPLDFLIILEPYFGYVVTKPPDVRHVIVFSSHLCLLGVQKQFFLLHLLPDKPRAVRAPRPYESVSWIPPIFHDASTYAPLGDHVHLDLTQSRSAHEAYLRLLTARELLRKPYSLSLNKRYEEVLSVQLARSRRHVGRKGSELEEWYWKDFEQTVEEPHYFILKKNPLSLE